MPIYVEIDSKGRSKPLDLRDIREPEWDKLSGKELEVMIKRIYRVILAKHSRFKLGKKVLVDWHGLKIEGTVCKINKKSICMMHNDVEYFVDGIRLRDAEVI